MLKYCYFSQDAHNAILDFDTNTSFWAVYDGHGGAEVSAYCALKLPEYLKKLDTYKGGDFEKALKDAFIGFDLTLLEPSVIGELQLLAKKNPDIGPEDSEEDEDENIADLYQEAKMPLREVLEKYKEKHGTVPGSIARLQKSEAASSKPLSPYLKGPRTEKAGASISSASGSSSSSSSSSTSHLNVNGGPSASIAGASSSAGPSATISVDDNDATVSSSSSGKCEDLSRDLAENQVCNVPDSSSSTATPKTTCNTDSVAEVSQSSTPTTKKPEPVVSESEPVTNGEVVCGSSEVTGVAKQTEGVSSSSSGAFENGEVSSNTNNEVKLVESSTDESEDEALEEGL